MTFNFQGKKIPKTAAKIKDLTGNIKVSNQVQGKEKENGE
jgi:hypothetical protein